MKQFQRANQSRSQDKEIKRNNNYLCGDVYCNYGRLNYLDTIDTGDNKKHHSLSPVFYGEKQV